MSIVQPIQINVALEVFENWDSLGVEGRSQLLTLSAQTLSANQALMAKWQIENAIRQIGESMIMPGPTGESNELATQGRGVFLCTATDATSEQVKVGLVGQVFAALIAGNTVITVGPEGQKIMDAMASVLPENVVQNIAASAQDSIIEADNLAGIAILCDQSTARDLNQRLAVKSGLISQLCEEIDSQDLSTIAAPHYVLRFVTEQTVSINTTAIGGNASLLALGSHDD
ncbi:1-pyrroline-5-carboxylate dehydrogenase [Marinomonas mediterranea]|jgi:Delta 1-pyrroline-5-carboxylate dehydrogenase|uniref:Delta-1-pyrroline-5-carboxylate dehydrogenase n=1 Tax=Marinomonas mediterranea (strain ATCC 700492 / JCM 21426 / NBRC 103028 / MMB-1) TaxID=717774 RepID=F2K119_MARM1|nr:1-pyrroline-5-carboxylate dehydrogenase [Marinomonas mediterranea]ADZ93368.1 delta-1-pyrroline-5-carboxylate dehydrogenase [Marinomonas mediterranea MMB-1]WCN11256.1 1-pyrroline-5-carboxylate dehydrogenase [Marinomonas mediterranea]WCN15320.1 1-pyrroline-5-carboxylate dehydrogenase [Marinomonas mediterranea]WCN19364.1 1-pyrroline-5-carboxylate dehydrogenase [Marinomonas mediterranea MMB-1]